MINFFERDSRKKHPDFPQTMGSFSVINSILEKGLRELGLYTDDPERAEFVGISDCLELNFKYKDKKPFVIAFLDNINTIAKIQYHYYHRNKGVQLFCVNQHTADIYAKYGIPCEVIGPGIDYDFWKQTKPKSDIFTITSSCFSSYRSTVDLLIQAYWLALGDRRHTRLIIKDTSRSDKLAAKIKEYQDKGANIVHLTNRSTFEELRDLYSESHVFCNVFRHSGHGLSFGEAGLCNCIVLGGDFDPSNKINRHGKLLKPTGEVEVTKISPSLVSEYGLTDTFGQLEHFEEPRIYDYSVKEYAYLLLECYDTYEEKDYSSIIKEDWNYKRSAGNLAKALL